MLFCDILMRLNSRFTSDMSREPLISQFEHSRAVVELLQALRRYSVRYACELELPCLVRARLKAPAGSGPRVSSPGGFCCVGSFSCRCSLAPSLGTAASHPRLSQRRLLFVFVRRLFLQGALLLGRLFIEGAWLFLLCLWRGVSCVAVGGW